jgi:heme A synthase
MRKWIGVGLIWVVTVVATGLWVHAQGTPRVIPSPRSGPNDSEIPTIISGNDIGFRVESWSKDGTPIGRIVVHQEGKWVDVTLSGRVRPLSTK